MAPWDSDHTALVHVLWAAAREGVTIKDADELASRIMASDWMRAVRVHAVDAAPPVDHEALSEWNRMRSSNRDPR